jgi:hypothetical protein
MFKRNAKFVSAVFASFLATAALATMSCGTAAAAAEECLAGPKQHTPPGAHWYFRIDHPTKRHCWYLGEEHGKVSQAVAPNSPPPGATDAQEAEDAMQPSIANARAELPAPATVEQPKRDDAPAPAMSANAAIGENAMPGADAPRWVVASRWPDQSDPGQPAEPAPDKPDSRPSESSASPPPPPIPVANQVAAARPSSEAPAYSMPMQLAALIGALTIAGIIGGVAFRFGAARRPDLSRAADDADDRDARVAEFFAQLSRRSSR